MSIPKKRVIFALTMSFLLTMLFCITPVSAADKTAEKAAPVKAAMQLHSPKNAAARRLPSKNALLKGNAGRSAKSAATVRTYISSDFIEIYEPEGGETYYIGERVPFTFDIYDIWEYYYTLPIMGIAPVDDDSDLGDAYPGESTVAVDDYDYYEDTITLSPRYFMPGTYCFYVFGVPTEGQYAESLGDASPDFDVSEYEYAETDNFYVRDLKSPSGLKARAGKHKVRISFRGASGASYYQIYRSTSRYSGYRRIKTTYGRSYTDRNVRKGRKYYYKVRSVRNVYNTIRSDMSYPKRSGRVR